MSAYRKASILATVLLSVGLGSLDLRAQQSDSQASVLHLQRSVTTAQTDFPTYFYVYHVLDGARSTAEAQALRGTLSLTNSSANFSEVLWLLAYWEGDCPVNATFTGAHFIWSDILKNPSQSTVDFPVDLTFPDPLPMTGCLGFIFGGGPLVDGEVTMSADLNLTYQPSSTDPDTVLDLSGEYCFGQNWGCQNATADNKQGFAVPIVMPAGHLVELFGNISDSTFDGTQNFGPLPTGEMWGAINDFYLLPDGCGNFRGNLNQYGFPNPVLLSTLYSWLPQNALHLDSVPLEYQIPSGKTGIATLQQQVERLFPIPVAVNAGSCMVVIYARTGNGATDNETQVKALLTP